MRFTPAHLNLASAALFLATWPTPSHAQAEQDSEVQVLILLYAARDTDDRCGGLSVEERQELDTFIEMALSEVQLTTEQRNLLESGLPEGEIDCKNPGFLEMFRMVSQESDAEPEQESDFTEQDIKEQLEAVVRELPAGQLGQVAGCWSGELQSWDLKLCFADDDAFQVTMTQAGSGAICQLESGQARSREGGAFFYAYPSIPECSDRRQLGHIEGICPELSQSQMSCFVSVYEHTNYFFTENLDESAELNGEVTFTRE